MKKCLSLAASSTIAVTFTTYTYNFTKGTDGTSGVEDSRLYRNSEI